VTVFRCVIWEIILLDFLFNRLRSSDFLGLRPSRAGAVNTCRLQDLEQWKIVSNVYPFLPRLTMNGQFIRDFIAAESPCFALGLVEERKRQCGFLALRPDEVIPPEIFAVGFNFGHALLGTAEFEVIQFVFQFYGFETYNVRKCCNFAVAP